MNSQPTSIFIQKAVAVHGRVYDYTQVQYSNSKTKVKIICKDHGPFFQTPEKHVLSRTKCPACSGRPHLTTELFVDRARLIHGNRYDYASVMYINDKTKVNIICKKHGPFSQSPGHHIHKKQGCPKCKHEKATERGIGGYSEQTICHTDVGYFYCVEMVSRQDTYLKVGITKTSPTRRLTGSGHQMTILHQTHGKLLDMFLIEQKVLQELRDKRYRVRPHNRHARRGWTECFRVSDKPDVLRAINDIIVGSAFQSSCSSPTEPPVMLRRC